MKIFARTFLVLALASVCVVAQDPRGGSRRGFGGMGRMVAPMIATAADADRSGDVSKEEWQGFVTAVKGSGEGSVDMAKLKAGIVVPMLDVNKDKTFTAADLQKMFKDLDRDESGALDSREMGGRGGSRFGRGRGRGQGQGGRSRGEGGEGGERGTPPNMEELLKKYDANGNGQLDPDERRKAREEMSGGEGGERGQRGNRGEGGERGQRGRRGEGGEGGERGQRGRRGEGGEGGERGQRGEGGEGGERGQRGRRGEGGEGGERGQRGEGGEGGERGQRGRRNRSRGMSGMMGGMVGRLVVRVADKDQSGDITAEEWKAYVGSLKKTEKGVLDVTDFTKKLMAPRSSENEDDQGGRRRGFDFFSMIDRGLDATGDDVVDLADLEELFDILDENEDKMLQKDEMSPGFGSRGRGRDI